MTIADNIDFLNEVKKFFEGIANNPSINETVKVYFTIESLESAIEVMRKYQKIEQIIADYEEYKWERIDIKDIREIIDGNVD